MRPGPGGLFKMNIKMGRSLAAAFAVHAAVTAMATGVEDKVGDVLSPSAPGAVHVTGHVGAVIDKVIGTRILSENAAAVIYPETIEAFRRRVDDRMIPNRGQWQGEFWGKWILSAVATQRYTDDARLKALVARAVDELVATQREDGYIGTYHDSGFVKLPDGKGSNWNVWTRKYTLWGLLEAGDLTGNAAALEASRRLLDHLMTEVGPGAVPIRDTGNFAGLPSCSILTPVVMLYRRTGDPRYLGYAHYIVHQWGAVPGQPPDILNKGLEGRPIDEWFARPETWTKAYEFISCVEGMVELYRATGNLDFLRAAENIHRLLREHERTVFGGIGKDDKLLKASLLLETEAEVCDAIYWNRLSAQLLRLTGKAAYADEIERTLYNVLLGAMNADGSWGVRRLCLSGAHFPAPSHCNLKTHHCCVDNMPRGLLQVPEVAVMGGPATDDVTINLYLPGDAHVVQSSGAKVTLRLSTKYPEDGRISVGVIPAKPAEFTLRFRIPPWSINTSIRINGAQYPAVLADGYAKVRREWRTGDQVDLELDMRTRLVEFPGDRIKPALERHVALMRGPVLLARDIRLGQPNIHDPVGIAAGSDGCVTAVPREGPKGMWLTFDITSAGGEVIRMGDYSSVGQTWQKETSDFRVWLPVRLQH